jgi:catechol 2,3-dioxygenase-like lactoylglutathione lyase family enzyme
MIDHVTIRVPSIEAGARFYDEVFRLLEFPGEAGGGFCEWNDFSIAAATSERPATRGLHVGFGARSHDQVDAWWAALTGAGYTSGGEPGPRPVYGDDYYGAFVLDPAGNSVEAVIHDRTASTEGVIDHLWVRVADLEHATRFYETLAPIVGHAVDRLAGRTRIRGAGASVSLLAGPPTEGLHLAFAAPDQPTVDAFHAAGLEAGYASLGAPGEHPEYHAGYYGAYLADPDGNNVEAVFHDRRG